MKQIDSAARKIDEASAGVTALGTRTVCVFDGGKGSDELEAMISRLGYRVADARGGIPPNGCIAAVVLASADPDFEVSQMLAKQVPVILFAEDDSFDFRLRVARSKVEAIVWSPLDAIELGAWLSEYDKSEDNGYSILIADDDEIAAHSYALALERAGMRAYVVTDATRVIDEISRITPDLVLLDLNMPQANGIEIARVLRQSRRNLSLPIVFLSAERDETMRHEARKIGGDDFISKPILLENLAAQVEIRAARAKSLRRIMERDSLTGLLNHARFKDRLAAEIDRSSRTGSPISVCLLDLDHFKSVNDTYGHQAGDQVIQTLAVSLSGSLRRTDVVARYGGEEFAILLLDTAQEQAISVIDKIRGNFEQLDFQSETGAFASTFSAGVAELNGVNVTTEALIGAADAALYKAKGAGRNRVIGA